MEKIVQRLELEVSNIENANELETMVEKLHIFLENLYLTLTGEGTDFTFEIYPEIDNLSVSGELSCEQKEAFATAKQYINQRIRKILSQKKENLEMKWER